jgi:hypothetical protein
LRGHYNYCGFIGNVEALNRFYRWAIASAFEGLNRRGGKRQNFTSKTLERILARVGVARPGITEIGNQALV